MGYSDVEVDRVVHFHSPNHPLIEKARTSLSKILEGKGSKIRVWSYPGPENDDAWSQAWLLAQLQALERADAVIALGGKAAKTANTLLHLAEARKIPVVPFSFLGGAAQRSFQRRDWERLHPGFDKSLLEQDIGVEKVIDIANRLVMDMMSLQCGSRKPCTFFVSRAIADAEIANALVESLKTRGYEVFLGDEVLRDDQIASSSIDQAILKSDVCIILWSEKYALSPWCYDELTLAVNRQMTIWIFNLDDSFVVPQKARKLKALSIRGISELLKIVDELLATFEVDHPPSKLG